MIKNYIKIFLIVIISAFLIFIKYKISNLNKINSTVNNTKIYERRQSSINKETMINIITDLEIAKAIVETSNYETQLKTEKTNEYKKNIFKNYGIDEDTFVFNSKLYAKNLDDFLSIYKEVEIALENIVKYVSI